MIEIEQRMIAQWGEGGSKLTEKDIFDFLGELPKYEDLPLRKL